MVLREEAKYHRHSGKTILFLVKVIGKISKKENFTLVVVMYVMCGSWGDIINKGKNMIWKGKKDVENILRKTILIFWYMKD